MARMISCIGKFRGKDVTNKTGKTNIGDVASEVALTRVMSKNCRR